MTIEGELATELAPAPPIKRENLPPVCRSEVLEHIGETITRVDWLLFLKGLRTPFSAEFNRRMQTCTLSITGKIVRQFHCEDPSETSELPYVLIKEGQKFVVVWEITDTKESFALQVNASPLDKLAYLDSSFTLETGAV